MNRALALAAALLFATGARAEFISNYGASSGGGGGTGDVTAVGTPTAGQIAVWVTATSIQGSTGLSVTTDAQTGTSYTVPAADNGALLTLSNASAVAVTLPRAIGSFTTGFNVTICNKGAGDATVTPTTSTINGQASQLLHQYSCVTVVSDGVNYSAITALAPNSGGNLPVTSLNSGTSASSSTFWRGDGTWAAASAAAAGTTLQVQYNSGGSFAGMNMWRTSADLFEVFDSTNAMNVNIYNTWAAAGANYERLNIGWSSNAWHVVGFQANLGTARTGWIGAMGSMFVGGGCSDAVCSNAQWAVSTSGHWLPQTNNAFDLGVDASRPRTVYAGTSVISPAYTVGSTAGVSCTLTVVAHLTVVNGIVTLCN